MSRYKFFREVAICRRSDKILCELTWSHGELGYTRVLIERSSEDRTGVMSRGQGVHTWRKLRGSSDNSAMIGYL